MVFKARILIWIAILIIAFIVGYKKSPKDFTVLALTAIVAISGWFIVHQLGNERNRINKHRDIRIEYLISAYRRLANSSQRHPKGGSPYFRDMESAIADIQLFGTQSQIDQVYTFLKEFKATGKGPLDDLLNNLRNDLRKELSLSEIEGNVRWFRPEGKP